MDNDDTEVKQVKKTSVEKFLDKLLELDIYAEPMNLTYQKKSDYKSNYGAMFSIFTIILFSIILVDNVVFYKPKHSCQYSQAAYLKTPNYTINLVEDFFLFFAVFNRSNVINSYLN